MPESSAAAASPALRAMQRQAPPSLVGTLMSVRSAHDVVNDSDDVKTVFIPAELYAFLTSPDHTVTQCMANSTVDSPVRVIAEHLYGMGYGEFGKFTGEQLPLSQRPAPPKPIKGVSAWLKRLNLRPKSKLKSVKEGAVTGESKEPTGSSRVTSDDDDSGDDAALTMRRLNAAELDEVRQCGRWRGTPPSDLFLNIYAQAVLTLEKNVLNGLVSPPLMGSSGVIPLTIISHSSDIVAHFAELIVNAKREIFFTTNRWEASEAARAMSDALRELSRRTVERGGDKIVVKLMYDRGVGDGPAHERVSHTVYSAPNVGLPHPKDVPGISLEVQNYHVPPVGSFHQKSVVIDRNVALLSSTNVQDRGDLGLMVQLEGPIVQSVYDTALLSWWTTLDPPPPLLYHSPRYPSHMDRSQFTFGAEHPAVTAKGDLSIMADRSRQRLEPVLPSSQPTTQQPSTPLSGASSDPPSRTISPVPSIVSVGLRRARSLVRSTSTHAASVTRSHRSPSLTRSKSAARSPSLTRSRSAARSPSLTRSQSSARSPSPASAPSPPSSHSASSMPPSLAPPGAFPIGPLPESLAVETSVASAASAPSTASAVQTGFNPLVLHAPHDPFSIALVNRSPRGRRGQGDTFVPQNQAWLAGFKFAEHSVFLQTPTFSAKPVVNAALDAVRRGVLVEIYADLGFNEQGEMSADGNANQAVAQYMYAQLKEEQRDNLRIYWYTAKDDNSPLGARGVTHTCHIKLMIIDNKIAVQGNGNMDVSSWYHAQEINILADSPQICAEWRAALDTNQDTLTYGRVGPDGVWRDPEGATLPAPSVPPVVPMKGF